jgi:hypothetical protein
MMPRLLYRCDKCKKLDFRESSSVRGKEHQACGGTWRPLPLPLRAIEILEEYERRIADLKARQAEALALVLEVTRSLEDEKGMSIEPLQAAIALLRGEEE